MLSYKNYKEQIMNESMIGGDLTLGIRHPHSMGVLGANLGPEGFKQVRSEEEWFEESKKKKRMDDESEEVIDADTDDGEVISDDDVPEKNKPKDSEEEEEEEGDDVEKSPCDYCKKQMKKNAKKQMKKEDRDWFNSVYNMLSSDPNERNWDGITIREDSLLPPTDLNSNLSAEEDPQPGDLGFAPIGKLFQSVR